jgi:hypothetical protein
MVDALRRFTLRLAIPAVLLVWPATALSAASTLQFDVFLGYDGIVPEASWFPVVCEIKNDGPPFAGVIEVTGGQFTEGSMQRTLVELPTGTLKRVTIPVFSTTRYPGSWEVRLLDERGKLRSEQSVRSTKQLAWEATLIGSLPRTVGGNPALRPIQKNQAELQPSSARFQSAIFPDNPLVLEALDAIYLNSEKAADLRVSQVDALLSWLHAGGHLIVGVEQVADVNGSPWLRKIVPGDLKDYRTVERHAELQEWIKTANVSAANPSFRMRASQKRPAKSGRGPVQLNVPDSSPVALGQNPFANLPDDSSFELAGLQVATGTMRGEVLVSAEETPLIVTSNVGEGRVSILLFSPEREPFRSWKNSSVFWAKMAEVPTVLYANSDFYQPYSPSADGIFGAMIDSRQVHKLPAGWLLLLLIAYLVIIGPLDQYWLKRIGKPMLTWITFPCYVVLFSLLIYFIGYKLRAGESEWNELHVVDVFSAGDHAELRGRTYASVYSPANQKYQVESKQKYATLRGEFFGSVYGGQAASQRLNVWQTGDSFKAELFVPVWTSQLYVSDWWQSAAEPVRAKVVSQANRWEVTVDNRTDRPLTDAVMVLGERVITLSNVPAGQTRNFSFAETDGTDLKEFVSRHGGGLQGVVQQRHNVLGKSSGGQISDLRNGTVVASFVSHLARQGSGSFVSTPGLDLSRVVERGNAVLLLWTDNYSPVKPINQFSPRRLHRNTLWRVPVSVTSTL